MAEIRAQVDINVKQNGKTNSSKNGIKAKVQEQKALNKEIKASGNFMDRFNKTLQSSSIAGWAALIKKTTDFLITAGKEQAGYVENLNLMQVAFGETADAAENFTDNLTKAIGLDPNTMTRQLGVFRQLSSAMGYSAETANLLSYNLSKLQLDMASLYNLDFDQAGNALESAITGRIQTIRSLTGVDITNAALQQFALANGIEESIHSMTRAEKALLIYLSLEEQLANANGDLANTINSVSNQTKIFKEQISVAGRQLGAVFIPILKTILPLLNGILMAFNELVAMFLTLIGADASSLTDEFGTASGGLNEIEDGLNGISTASKEAKKSLRGFDKLNNITTPSKGSGSGDDKINSKILEMLKEYNLQLEKMENTATAIRDKIMEWLGFSKKVDKETGKISWEYEGIWTTVKNITKSLWELPTISKLIIGAGLLVFFSKMYNWVKKIAALANIKTIKNFFNYAIKRGLEPALDFTTKLMTPVERMMGAIGGIIGMFAGISGIVNAIRDIAEEGLNASNGMELLFSFVTLVTGAIVTMTMATGAFKTEMALATGGISLIVGAIVGLISYFGYSAKATEANVSATQKYKDALVELEDTIANNMKETYAQASRAEDLKNKLSELVDENGRVKGSHKEVEIVLKELNDIMGTNYAITNGQITLDGKLIGTKKDLIDTVGDYIDKLKAEMLVEYSREKIQLIYERNLELKEKEKQLFDELTKKSKNYHLEREEDAKKFYEENSELIRQLGLIQEEIETNDNQLSLYAEGAMEAEKGHFKAAEELMLSTAKQAKKSIADIYGQLTDVFNEKIVTEIEVQLEIDKKKLEDAIKKNNEAFAKQGITGGLISGNFNGVFANGGFPTTGQMFVARENGPEMVGTIGHKTAVANNDQIVEAISVGVAKAMMATGGRDTTVNITAEGDTSGLLDFITFKQKEQNRQYGLG